MRPHRVGEAREGHFFSGVHRIEERLELSRVRMIRDIAGIEHLHGEGAPRIFICFYFL